MKHDEATLNTTSIDITQRYVLLLHRDCCLLDVSDKAIIFDSTGELLIFLV